MKILYMYRYLIHGGVSTQLVNRLAYLKSRADVHFVFFRDLGGRAVFGTYPHVHVMNRLSQVREYIDRHRFDVIISIDTEEAYRYVDGSSYTGKLVHEVHSTTKRVAYLRELPVERVAAILVPSVYVRKMVQDDYGFGERVPCHVTPNCLDLDRFRARPVTGETGRKVIAWIGKLDEHKNWRGFLALARAVMQRRDDCEFWMVGGETAKDEVAADLLQTAGSYGLLSRLRWIEHIDYDDMPLLYSRVAASGGLTVSTSQNESFGMTLVESLACGCPAVAPRVGAVPEVLGDRFEDCLYEHFVEEEAVAKMVRLLDDEGLREHVVSAGLERVKDFSIEAVGEAYLKVLQPFVSSFDKGPLPANGRRP